jgi:hypothetical protein
VSRLTRRDIKGFTCTGLSPSMGELSSPFQFPFTPHWAPPVSLVTTNGISIDFFSSRYLDISVLWVRSANLCIQFAVTLRLGFPIRKSTTITPVGSSSWLIAAYYVLLRLSTPRHPSNALTYLTLYILKNLVHVVINS